MRKNYLLGSLKTTGLFLTMLLFLSGGLLHAQTTYRIHGNVTDNLGEAAVGATVKIKGTTMGVMTDVDGNYSLQVNLKSGNYTLVFSSVGFTTKEQAISLGNSTDITVNETLATDILGFDEVVITGTGALTAKKQLGNTISSLKGADIASSGSLDLTGGLSGKLAGIQVSQNSGDPAGGISVRLRSASTVNGSSDPLYIVDGVIVNNNSTDVLNTGGFRSTKPPFGY